MSLINTKGHLALSGYECKKQNLSYKSTLRAKLSICFCSVKLDSWSGSLYFQGKSSRKFIGCSVSVSRSTQCPLVPKGPNENARGISVWAGVRRGGRSQNASNAGHSQHCMVSLTAPHNAPSSPRCQKPALWHRASRADPPSPIIHTRSPPPRANVVPFHSSALYLTFTLSLSFIPPLFHPSQARPSLNWSAEGSGADRKEAVRFGAGRRVPSPPPLPPTGGLQREWRVPPGPVTHSPLTQRQAPPRPKRAAVGVICGSRAPRPGRERG